MMDRSLGNDFCTGSTTLVLSFRTPQMMNHNTVWKRKAERDGTREMYL